MDWELALAAAQRIDAELSKKELTIERADLELVVQYVLEDLS